MTYKLEKYARRFGRNPAEVKNMEKSLHENQSHFQPAYHSTGFAHYPLPVITNEAPDQIQPYLWGLIPFWVKDVASAEKISNMCLNAVGETIFKKPAFRAAAQSRRCLVLVDGGFEHHHQNGKTYPFFFKVKGDEPFAFAGLWEKWVYEDITKYTCTIVTTTGNALMEKIHNNPKAKEARMPVILPKALERDWLNPINDKADQELLEELIMPYEAGKMEAYPVPKLRGKEAVGNSPEALQQKNYPELSLDL